MKQYSKRKGKRGSNCIEKYKKPKNSIIKKENTDKEQTAKQCELSKDNETVGQQEELADREQRRTTRVGAILAIIVVIGTLCTSVFKVTVALFNIWPVKGIWYYRYPQIICSVILAIITVIVLDIVFYVISDLKRYNIKDSNYKQYDLQSDNIYSCLVEDVNVYAWILLVVFSIMIFIVAVYSEGIEQIGYILAIISCLISGIILIWTELKSHRIKEVWKALKNIIKCIGKLIILGLIWTMCGFISVINITGVNKVDYKTDGLIEICNTAAENYNGLDITIYNMDNQIVHMKSVEEGEILFATENENVSNQINDKKEIEALFVNSQVVHWKYIFNLKEVIKKPGRYRIEINTHKSTKSITLTNDFVVEDEKYVFAEDNMEKEY